MSPGIGPPRWLTRIDHDLAGIADLAAGVLQQFTPGRPRSQIPAPRRRARRRRRRRVILIEEIEEDD